MNKYYKIIIGALASVLITCFTGCTPLELNIEKILMPPKLSDLQIKITKALESTIEGEYTIKYPKNGKYSSGFNFIDLNDDDVDEAICFFKTTKDDIIKMALLYTQNDDWYVSEIISDFAFSGDIDFIDYREIGGKNKLLIGLQLEDTTKSVLAVYDCKQNTYNKFSLKLNNKWDYSELLIQDYNLDGKTDLIFFEVGDKFKDTSPNMYFVGTDNYGMLVVKNYFPLPTEILDFNKIQIGKIDETNRGLFIDAKLNNGYYCTYVYKFEGNEAFELLFDETNYRKIPVNCEDIDNDGIIEIPIQNLANGYTRQSPNVEYFIDYIQFKVKGRNEIGNNKLVLRTYIDFNNSVYFKIPKLWYSLPLSIFTYQDKTEIIFFINENKDVFDHKKELLRIRVYYSQDIIDKLDLQRYFLIGERNGKVYMGYVPNENTKKYFITQEEVKNLFTIL